MVLLGITLIYLQINMRIYSFIRYSFMFGQGHEQIYQEDKDHHLRLI
jgi:hypothetical protein